MPKALYKFKFSVVELATQQTDHIVIFGDNSFFNALKRARKLVSGDGYEVRFCGATENK